MKAIVNYNYTVSCVDRKENTLVFRDVTGLDIEYLDYVMKKNDKFLTSSDVIKILELLLVSPKIRLSRLTPGIIKKLYICISENILCNYMNKENWLRQCYSVQNGSFQNISEMEKVPLSKFIAMCTIHKEAMDQLNTPPTASVQ